MNRNTATRSLAGVIVPDTPLVARAMEHARENSEPYLFNHVMRSWLFSAAIAQLKDAPHDPEVLAVATLLHDLGLARAFDGHLRFEVEGANAARAFARAEGMGGAPGTVDLGWGCAQLDAIHRSLQGDRGRSVHDRHRDHVRQFHARFRRAIRAGLQETVRGRFPAELAVR